MNENSKSLLNGCIEKLRKKLDGINEKLVEYSYDENMHAKLRKQRAIVEMRIGEAQRLLLGNITN